jgi:hypothetical protein
MRQTRQRFARWLSEGHVTIAVIEIRRGEPEPEPRSAPLWDVLAVALSLALLLGSILLLAALIVLLPELAP